MPVDPFALPEGTYVAAVGLHLNRPDDPDEAARSGITGWMDVDERHHTPWGTVHGGVWAGVVESAASVGASLAVASRGQYAVGVTNTTDFLRPLNAGRVYVAATPVQIGRSLQLWEVAITSSDGKLLAHGRLRLANQPLPASLGASPS